MKKPSLSWNPPKFFKDDLEQQKIYLYYKWEHLRRRKSYQKDYDAGELAKKEGKPIPWSSKYGIFRADYRNEYPGRVTKNAIEEAVVFFSQMLPSDSLRVDAWSRQALSQCMGFTPYELPGMSFAKMKAEDTPRLKRMKTLRLVVDIRQPKEHLLKKFEMMLNHYKNFVKNIPPPDHKKRFQDYKNDLKAWDCYHGADCDWKKAAAKFYRNRKFGSHKDASNKYDDMRNFKRAVTRCQNRINKGI